MDFVDQALKLRIENLQTKNKNEEKELTIYKFELSIKQFEINVKEGIKSFIVNYLNKTNKMIYYIVLNNKLFRFKVEPIMYISARVRNSDEKESKKRDQDLLSNFIEDFTDFLLQDDDA